MKELVIKVPDDFTDEQEKFILNSCFLQISSEMRKGLKVPREDIDAVEAKISDIREAMGIKIETPEMPSEPIKE